MTRGDPGLSNRGPSTFLHLAVPGSLVAAAGWSWWSERLSGGDATPQISLFLTCAIVWVAAFWLSRVSPSLVPVVVVVGAVIVVARSWPEAVSSEPLSEPFGYANAKAAFFVQVALAGALLFLTSKRILLRVVGFVVAVGFVSLTFPTKSIAALVLGLCAMVATLVVWARRGTAPWVSGAATIAVATALVMTTAVAATQSNDGRSETPPERLGGTLDERRIALWHEALVILKEHPESGVGPGRFRRVSPTARRDPDAHWAHHGFLQQGSETGIPGLALLIVVFGAGFALLLSRRSATGAAIGATALGALGVHACIDYVLHFGVLPTTTAALVGVAASLSPPEVAASRR